MTSPQLSLLKQLGILISFSLLSIASAQDVLNSLDAPIIKGGLNVHIAPFVQIPNVNNETAKILCMVPKGKSLFVGTNTQIFRVDPTRSVQLWFDVDKALKENPASRGLVPFGIQAGLRSVAFHPGFNKNGLFYTSQVEFSATNPSTKHYLPTVFPIANASFGESVVSEWRFDHVTKVVSSSTYREVFRVRLRVTTHPIKQIAFRKDRLFIAHGDSSELTAKAGGGQNPDALGKILAIRPAVRGGGLPYKVPGNNPFFKTLDSPALGNRREMIPEVYALGLRNPHNLCFSKNGTLYVTDIGRGNVEEVNIIKKGKNYGWPMREGTFVHFQNQTGAFIKRGVAKLPLGDANPLNRVFEYPAAQWGHRVVVGTPAVPQAIAGGCPVENGSPVSGIYFYADFSISGRLFYSHVDEMMSAKTNGLPKDLTQAPTRLANIFFDDDDDPSTPAIRVNSLRGIILRDPAVLSSVPPEELENVRVDLRFGRGESGEVYISSKTNGKVYIMTSSQVGGPGGPE